MQPTKLTYHSSCSINQSFMELLPQNIQLKEIHREICPMIRSYPEHVLAVVQIGNVIIKRIRVAEPDDMDFSILFCTSVHMNLEPLYIHSHEQLFNGMVSIAILVKYINEAKIPADEEKILFEAILKKRSTKGIMKICNAERRED